jgi:recombination protein RecT
MADPKKSVTRTDDNSQSVTINTFRDFLDKSEPALRAVATKHLQPERLIRIALAAISRNPQLLKCDRNSILQAVMAASQIGLEPNTPLQHAALVPYWNTQTTRYEAQFQPMYRGLIELAFRGGQVTQMRAVLVYDEDKFEFFESDENLCPRLIHRPNLDVEDRGAVKAAYLITRMRNTDIPFIEVMSRAQLLKIKARALANKKNISASPWVTDEDEMFRKTVVKRGSKFLPIGVEFAKAAVIDNAIESGTPIDYSALESHDTTAALDDPAKSQADDLKSRLGAPANGAVPASSEQVEIASAAPPSAQSADGLSDMQGEMLGEILEIAEMLTKGDSRKRSAKLRSWTDNYGTPGDLAQHPELFDTALDRARAERDEAGQAKAEAEKKGKLDL